MSDNNFDSSLYPRTYTASPARKLFIGLMALSIILLEYWYIKNTINIDLYTKLFLISILCICYIFVSRTFAKTILHPDAIEYAGVLKRSKVTFKSIIGYSTPSFTFIPLNLPMNIKYKSTKFHKIKEGSILDNFLNQKSLGVAMYFQKDDVWYSWMSRVNNLDPQIHN